MLNRQKLGLRGFVFIGPLGIFKTLTSFYSTLYPLTLPFKFIYSEKATKNIFVVCDLKNGWRFFQIFVAFSEYIKFTLVHMEVNFSDWTTSQIKYL